MRSCHPRPGAAIQPSRTEYIIPDVFVRRTPQGWVVELNRSAVPQIRLNEGYAGLITRASAHAALRTQLQEARWLLKSLEIRNDTLVRVARTIVERQSAFLERGEEAMQPLILRDIALSIGTLHGVVRDLGQVPAHPARRFRAALLLFEPGSRR